MRSPVHNHNMWAVIGIYTGREDNIFWRKLKDGKHIEAAGAKSLMAGTAVGMVIYFWRKGWIGRGR